MASPTPGTTPGAGEGATETEATALLSQDHREVRALFAQYERSAQGGPGASDRRGLAERICLMLEAHTRLEEELFYPEAREVELAIRPLSRVSQRPVAVFELQRNYILHASLCCMLKNSVFRELGVDCVRVDTIEVLENAFARSLVVCLRTNERRRALVVVEKEADLDHYTKLIDLMHLNAKEAKAVGLFSINDVLKNLNTIKSVVFSINSELIRNAQDVVFWFDALGYCKLSFVWVNVVTSCVDPYPLCALEEKPKR